MIVEKVDLVADRAKCINEYSHVFKVAPKEIEDQIKKVLDELDKNLDELERLQEICYEV